MFKPNLIPNSDVSNPIDLKSIIGDNVKDYVISYKKDGCRMELVNGQCLSRSLKPVESKYLVEKYQKLADKCKEMGMILEGEIYAHGLRFPEILRFFSTEDITSDKKVKELTSDLSKFNRKGTKKNPIWEKISDIESIVLLESKGYKSKFEQDWPGRTVEFMSTYPKDLKLWVFDCYFPDFPQLEYKERMVSLLSNVIQEQGELHEFSDIIHFGWFANLVDEHGLELNTWEDLEKEYNTAIELGYEGLVINRADRTYKCNRSTEKEATIFKMKEDKLEFDGVVLDILEGTIAKEGAPKTTNELGRSVTSKLQEDREPSGIAKGILSEYNGHEITVSFEGYSHEELKEVLENKKDYIGKWFTYQGMKPTKNVPRHAHMQRNSWRDEK